MKPILLILVFSAMTIRGHGQGSQIKLYLQQIAANKVYIEYLQKGYQIVKKGWNTIGDIKKAHFKLDDDFFKALEGISPKVLGYAKVGETISLQLQVNSKCKKLLKYASTSGIFTGKELDYFNAVVKNVSAESLHHLDDLQAMITPAKFKMSDDERIGRIDLVCTRMQEVYSFISAFTASVQKLAIQRAKEQAEIKNLQTLHGIQP